MRGLDYYNDVVYEWTTTRLGAQGTVCAGGRYDGLIEQIGGKPAPACGFAMGMERLLALLADAGTAAPGKSAGRLPGAQRRRGRAIRLECGGDPARQGLVV